MVFANSPWSMKFADNAGMLSVAGQIFVDNFVFNILCYFPMFYMFKAMVQENGSPFARAEAGLRKYRKNLWTDNTTSCAVWIPLDVVIFAMPMYMRMPLEHAVSFGWTMFMSATRGAPEKCEAKNVISEPDKKLPFKN